jgi:hypothetical protein
MTNQVLARPRTQAQKQRATMISRPEMTYGFIVKPIGSTQQYLYTYRRDCDALESRDYIHEDKEVIVLSKVNAYSPVDIAMLDDNIIIY